MTEMSETDPCNSLWKRAVLTDEQLAEIAKVPESSNFKVLTSQQKSDRPARNQAILQLMKKLNSAKPQLSKEDAVAIASSILKHWKSTAVDSGEATDHQEASNELFVLLLLANEEESILDIDDNLGEDMCRATAEHFPDDFQMLGNALKLTLLQKAHSATPAPKRPFEYPPFQKAMPFFPNNGYQLTLTFAEKEITGPIKSKITVLLAQLTEYCNKVNSGYPKDPDTGLTVNHCDFNVAFEPSFWVGWYKLLGVPVPAPVQESLTLLKPENNFVQNHPKLIYTGRDVWFFLKADEKKHCDKMVEIIEGSELFAAAKSHNMLQAYKAHDAKIFGGQFQDGISNAIDPMSLIRGVLLKKSAKEKAPYGGAAFVFTQLFQFDTETISGSSNPDRELMIGRNTLGEFLPVMDVHSHAKMARLVDPKDGSHTEFLRQALPLYVDDGSKLPMEEGLAFVAFGKGFQEFFDVLKNMLGAPNEPFSNDKLLRHTQGVLDGNLLYCPSTQELKMDPLTEEDLWPPIPFWMKFRSCNKLLFYNHVQYLHAMTTGLYTDCPPTKRVLYLMSEVFSRWHSTWHHKLDVPRLPHLREFLRDDEKAILDQPIQLRKGYSYKKMLGEVLTSHSSAKGAFGAFDKFDTYRLSAKELIVGVTDRLSFGSGKEVMPYINPDEVNFAWDLGLTEFGNMGHIVPGHKIILDLGVSGMLKKLHDKKDSCKPGTDDEKLLFYNSAIYAYEGVKHYLLRYSKLALDKLCTTDPSPEDAYNLVDVALRMLRLAEDKPRSFHDAVQMIFSMHCCLHLVGQAVSVGNVDRLLVDYYERDVKEGNLTPEDAQEIIDAFFIKFDEHVVLNRYHIPYGHTTYGSTCVLGRGGVPTFPTGDSMNQWIQQITVGGYGSNGKDMCNDVTLMCLKASRRLPLNAPCLSFRLTPQTPQKFKQEAAKAILSGGAHPILFCDDKMVQGLLESLKESYRRVGIPEPSDLYEVATGYSCDGCFEPMFTGRSEFKFAYVNMPKAVTYTLNIGMNHANAGTLFLAGVNESYRTDPPEDIDTFDKFLKIFRVHLLRLVQNLYGLILGSYGNPWKICPSPLLSCLLEGCVESGRDMTNGGSRFRILTPMLVGFANTVNSLYNVKQMVYSKYPVATLSTLRMALINNWGEKMVEPFYDQTGEGTVHTAMWSGKFKELRDYALELPKFGTDTANAEINDLAEWLAKTMDEVAHEALYDTPLADLYKSQRENITKSDGNPFLWQVMTGSGTFESYVNVGSGIPATPDGRLTGQPTASDASPQPFPQDLPVPPEEPLDIIETLKPYHTSNLHKYIPNGAEIDLMISEDFPIDDLLAFMDSFAKGETGSNLVTITCVNRETLQNAQREPQRFDLIRNRMGGWSNFYVAMFASHQKHHERRRYFKPHSPRGKNN